MLTFYYSKITDDFYSRSTVAMISFCKIESKFFKILIDIKTLETVKNEINKS